MELMGVSDYLMQNKSNMLDLVVRLAKINSGSFNLDGLNKVADMLRQEYAALECEHITMPMAPLHEIDNHGDEEQLPLGPVLRFIKRPEAPMQVLLVGHMDTVYDAEHRFQHTSMTGGDILHGPGVADMKGGLAIMLWGLKAFEQLPQAKNLGWEVILTSDEEIGSPGSSEIIESRGRKHKVGMVFEPAMDDLGTLAGERKGSAKFTLVMRGKSAHAGRNFNDGRNAICKMSEVIGKINNLNGQREGLTVNVGFVRGGEAVNVVPDCCICKLDVRILKADDADWIRDALKQITADVNAEASGYKLELHGTLERKPKILTPDTAKLYDIVKSVGAKLGQTISWKPSGGCCDGNNLSAIGLPNVDTLGVRGGKIHSEQEYMLVPSLVERALLVSNLLAYLSENGF